MAADLPPLQYGYVKARFTAGVGESAGSPTTPDVIPLSGTVTFNLSASVIRVTTALPVPTTVYPQPITAAVDSDGYLTWNGEPLVPLIATDDPAMNPTDLQWTVSFDLRTPDGYKVPADPWRFVLPAGEIIDLTDVAPLTSPAPNTVIVKGDQGVPGPSTIPAADFIGSEIERPGSPARVALNTAIGEVGAPVAQGQFRALRANRIHNAHKLARFALARAREDVTPAVITCLTHSIGWGIGSDDVNGGMVDPNGLYRENAWPVVLRKLFSRDARQPVAQNFLGLYPAYGVASLSTSPAPAGSSGSPFNGFTGNTFSYTGYNLYASGLASITIPSTMAGRFTALDVPYWGSDSGVTKPIRPKVTVDTTVADAGTTTVVSGSLNVMRLSGFSDTAHDITISHPGGSTNNPFVFCAIPHRGTGVIVNRIGAPSAKAYDIAGAATGSARTRNVQASVLAGYSDLVIIELDTNDVYAQTPIVTWKGLIQEAITEAVASGASVLLVSSPPIDGGESSFTIPESAYQTAARELSDANDHVAYWPGHLVVSDRTQAVADGLYPPSAPTTVHFGTTGHRDYATALHAALPLPYGDYSGGTITPPTITTETLNAMFVGAPFSQALASTGTPPITYAVQSGALPAGLTLSSAGVISRTPTTSGAYSVTVRATNSGGTDDQTYTGTVASGTGFTDAFDRADSAITLGSTGDGKPWVTLNSSVWGITGNAAYCPTPGSRGYAYVASGAQNGTLTVVFLTLSDYSGVAFRIFDVSNLLYVQRVGSTLELRKVCGGVGSTLATATGLTFTSSNTLSVSMVGTAIAVSLNGVQVLTATVTDFATNKNHGLTSAGTTARFGEATFVAS